MGNKYYVDVKTGSQFDASGTSAHVFIQFFGKSGKSPEIRLDNAQKNDFEPGHLDRFDIEIPDIGALEGVAVRHDNTGNSPGWFLEYVKVTEQAPGAASWYADICRWLTNETGGVLLVRHDLKPTRAGWMKALYDRFATPSGNPFGDVPLCQLPMPGTHDSATFDMTDSARTQNRSIAEQLDRGIRFFDFRVKYNNDKFYPYHGSTDLAEGDYSHHFARWGGDDNWRPSAQYMDDQKCIFGEMRKFLQSNPHEIIIIKMQSFTKYGTQEFDDGIHKRFRILLDSYFSLIEPGPVSALTLNKIYQSSGRVIAFYRRDALITKKQGDPWGKFWPYRVEPDQKKAGILLSLVDPYWADDLGGHSVDSDDVTYHHRWLPYHIQNLCDWQARSVARFFATQAHHQALPTAAHNMTAVDIAKITNPKNIEQIGYWLKNGVPGTQGKLRPNIIQLDYIEHPTNQNKVADAIVEYFSSLTPENFTKEYKYYDFDIVSVYALEDLDKAGSFRFRTGNINSWNRREAAFLAHRTQVNNAIRVYEERSDDGRYHYSTRSAADAKKLGWTQTDVAFFAYGEQVSGTVPVYRETQISAPHKLYNYSPREAKEARKDGWQQLDIAFYAYECVPDTVTIYAYYESDRHGYYRLSQNPRIEYRTGWEPAGGRFRAYSSKASDRVPVYEEKSADGRYHYSTRSASDAKKYGWTQGDTAFFAYGTKVPGTVPVYRETPIRSPHERYHYAARTAAEAEANGWKQLDIAFYAYEYIYD